VKTSLRSWPSPIPLTPLGANHAVPSATFASLRQGEGSGLPLFVPFSFFLLSSRCRRPHHHLWTRRRLRPSDHDRCVPPFLLNRSINLPLLSILPIRLNLAALDARITPLKDFKTNNNTGGNSLIRLWRSSSADSTIPPLPPKMITRNREWHGSRSGNHDRTPHGGKVWSNPTAPATNPIRLHLNRPNSTVWIRHPTKSEKSK